MHSNRTRRSAFAKRVADDYRAAVNRKRLLDEAFAQQTREFIQIAEKSIHYNILRRDWETNTSTQQAASPSGH